MVNFAISLVILALCGGAQHSAQPAKAEAKADGAHCAMHASKKDGAAGEAKSCCTKHADAKSTKAGMAAGECKHADGKTADAKHAAGMHADAKHAEGASCCAKHEKPAAGAAAHSHAAAGASCKHDAKPATAAAPVVNAQPKTDAKPVAAYVCPMHPDITSSTPADCSKCGMKLEKKS